MEIYTIGFTKRKAAEFFEPLRRAEIRRLLDVRLNNTSQLAGFTKRDDLEYFLREICDAEYAHAPELAPSEDILEAYRDDKDWVAYEREFLALIAARKVEETLDREAFAARTVLLCSEPTEDRCHRRLVAEYLREKWGDVRIVHL